MNRIKLNYKSTLLLLSSLFLTAGLFSVPISAATIETQQGNPSLQKTAPKTSQTVSETQTSTSTSTAALTEEQKTLPAAAANQKEAVITSSLSQTLTNPASSTTVSSATTSAPKAKKDFGLKDYLQTDATALAAMVRKGDISSQELVKLALKAVEQTNGDLNNVISLRSDEALKEAQQLKDTGQPFLGVPLLVKGLGHTIKGGQNTNGLSFMAGTLSSSTGRYVKALQDAGFIIIGQTSYPEMGWINVTNSDLYGITHNPWNLAHNPGGSSGGSAAAVAIGQVPIASASDGGGSIRIPASWSGTIGFFPTIGVTAGNSATTYNNVGHFAESKTMRDTENLFNALLKTDVLDNSLSKNKPIAYTRQTPAGTPISPDALKALDQAVTFLKSQGYQMQEVNYPINGQQLMKAYYTLAASSASSLDLLAQKKLKRHLQLGDTELLTWALYQTSRDLTKKDLQAAYAQIDSIRAQMSDFYQKFPVFLTPTTAFPAPSADYHHISPDMKPRLQDMSALTKAEKLQLIYDQWLPAWTLTPYTQLANLTQTPAISLPTYVTADGLPLGIMFNTYQKNDCTLLALGRLFEDAGLFQTFYHHLSSHKTESVFNNPSAAGQSFYQKRSVSHQLFISKSKQPSSPLQQINSRYSFKQKTLSQSQQQVIQSQAFLPQTNTQDESHLILLGLSCLLLFTISYPIKSNKSLLFIASSFNRKHRP